MRRWVTACLLALVGSLLVFAPAAAQRQNDLPPGFPRQYKREHQRALKDIVSGRVERAITGLKGLAERIPDDAETQFMLAVAYHKQGDDEQAIAHAKQALELDLPPGRLLGGGHNGLWGIENLAEKLGLEDQLKRPVHGPMLGNATGSSIDIWVRTAGAKDVRVVYSTSADLSEGQMTSAQRTRPENDFAAVLTVEGLKPDTEYHYAIEIDGGRTREERYTFRTPAAKGAPVKFRFAFGGGAGYVPPNERVWDTIRNEKPDTLVLLGDNVYIDDPQTPAMQHYCYYRRQSRPEFRKLIASTPVYTIWDDHDFATNDSQGGPAIEVPAWKRPVYEVYRQNWVNPAYGGGDEHPGVYYDFYRGDVHFIMLDGRYYRDRRPADGGTPTMLGPVQKAWLKETLKGSTGKLIFLASPVPWVFEAKGDSPDTWNGFQQERNEIFALLAENKIEGVVLISADRHRSDLWKIDRSGSYALYELNSSRLTNQHVHGTMKEAIFSYNAKQSFGTVDVDTTADDPTVTYRVVNIDGEEVHQYTVKRSELQ